MQIAFGWLLYQPGFFFRTGLDQSQVVVLGCCCLLRRVAVLLLKRRRSFLRLRVELEHGGEEFLLLLVLLKSCAGTAVLVFVEAARQVSLQLSGLLFLMVVLLPL